MVGDIILLYYASICIIIDDRKPIAERKVGEGVYNSWKTDKKGEMVWLRRLFEYDTETADLCAEIGCFGILRRIWPWCLKKAPTPKKVFMAYD